MLKPVEEFQVDILSQETSGNTSKAQTGDLWRHKHKSTTPALTVTRFSLSKQPHMSMRRLQTQIKTPQAPHTSHLCVYVCVTYSVCWRDEVTPKGGLTLPLSAGGTMGGSLHCPVCLWLSDSPVVRSLGHWYILSPQPSSITTKGISPSARK